MKKLDEAVAAAVRDRVSTRGNERETMRGKIAAGGILSAARPSDAIARAVHLQRSEAASILRPTGGRAAGGKKLLEATIGDFDDSDHVNFLLRGTRAVRAVCRIILDGAPIGTGFLVAPGVIMTNHHVIASADEAATLEAEFDYELDIDDQPRRPIVRFALNPGDLFATSPEGELDYTLVATARTSKDETAEIGTFGWLPMDERRGKILEGEPVLIIQHPRGEQKRICLFAAELVDRYDDFVHYTTDTDNGSSGSPAFNRNWQLVALHHAAVDAGEKRRGHDVYVNEGIRISSVLASLASSEDRKLQAIYDRLTQPDVLKDGRPQSPGVEAVVRDLRNAPSPAHPPVRESTRVATRDPSVFLNRSEAHLGYKPDFLGAIVPIPTVPDAWRADVAKQDDGDEELRYTHYSVLFSSSRRLPIVTAVNVDGTRSRRLTRTDRKYEGDRWYRDPRIDPELQLGPEIYDGTPFDYGHLVRREDPVWSDEGDENTARMANDDTFYMTNCAPQHSDLNRKTWVRLEDALLASARDNRIRISVFTGPVLSPQDQMIGTVQVPNAFWKVVAYVGEDGELRAHGFMQWQTELVDDARRELEGIDAMKKAVEFVVPIVDIARDCGLDFGPLLAAEAPLGAVRERLGSRRPLTNQVVDSLGENLRRAGGARGTHRHYLIETPARPTFVASVRADITLTPDAARFLSDSMAPNREPQ